jgi:hypothetical protein
LPVEVWIEKISRNGEVEIRFNQELHIPFFVNASLEEIINNRTNNTDGRILLALDKIDVARDVF